MDDFKGKIYTYKFNSNNCIDNKKLKISLRFTIVYTSDLKSTGE